MLIIRLTGGLGNQMFQYAIGRNLAIKNKTKLYLDLSGLTSGFVREYGIGHFNIDVEIATKEDVENILGGNKVTRKIVRVLNEYLPLPYKRYVKEKTFDEYQFKKEILEIHPPIYIDGYWQNSRYFEEIFDVLKKEFTLKELFGEKLKDILSEINKPNSVSVHIRRGDYLASNNVSTYKTYGDEYVTGAIKYMSEQIKDPHFFFFSDDIDWVKNNIHAPKATYVSELKTAPQEDILLMSMCSHNIIANSSFSWWGAWLNKNNNKIVIAPKKWINDDTKNTEDLIPKTWIKL